MKLQKWFMIFSLLLAVGFALALTTGTAMAGAEICDNGTDDDGDEAIDCKDSDCADDAACQKGGDLCHNIGGPNALGANCDAGNCHLENIVATGDQTLIDAFVEALFLSGQTSASNDIYGGIVVPFGDAAFTAHFNHGDGFTLVTFDRVHATQPHVAANVGCFAVRHDPDPGN